MEFPKLWDSKTKESKSRTVVKVVTSYWCDKRGVYSKRSFKVLKRKSFGYNLLLEECAYIGTDVVKRILNFNDVEDGIYEVVICNISRDWESGQIDDWDLELVEFKE